jgi:hypothetical protein
MGIESCRWDGLRDGLREIVGGEGDGHHSPSLARAQLAFELALKFGYAASSDSGPFN